MSCIVLEFKHRKPNVPRDLGEADVILIFQKPSALPGRCHAFPSK